MRCSTKSLKLFFRNLGLLILFAIGCSLLFTLIEGVLFAEALSAVTVSNLLLDGVLFIGWISFLAYLLALALVHTLPPMLAATVFIGLFILLLEMMDIGFIIVFTNDRVHWEQRIILLAAAAFAYRLATGKGMLKEIK